MFDKNKITTENGWLSVDGEISTSPVEYRITNYIKIFPNTSYVVSGLLIPGRNPAYCFYDINKNYISGEKHNARNTYTFTTPENAYYFRDSIDISSINSYKLEKGSTATDYVEHKEQVFTFPLGNEKLMLGDYLADDGIHHVRGQVIFDGSEDEVWSQFNYTTNENNFRVQNDIALPNILTPPTNPANLLCNYFKSVNRDNAYVKTVVGIAQYGLDLGTIFISAPISILQNQTVQGWKDWLAEHNLIVEYLLAEEVIVPYTSAQQEVYNQIKQALSYEKQTNISSNTIALFNVEAYQSTKLVLQDFATAIVALGGV